MKKAVVYFTVGVFALFTIGASAQKITEGDKKLTFLKGEKTINLEFTYDNMMVGKKTEDQYRKDKKEAFDKKEAGKGDKWEKKWVENRANVYEPMFLELINKQLDGAMSASKDQKDAKYTIKVHTTFTEPGFNSVVMKVNPSCDFEFSYIEKSSGKIVAKGILEGVAGINMADSGWDFDPANSIKECYAKAGKVVGNTISKNLKK